MGLDKQDIKRENRRWKVPLRSRKIEAWMIGIWVWNKGLALSIHNKQTKGWEHDKGQRLVCVRGETSVCRINL
jgi:hypothetical protein